jgi:hypothetical protein
MIKLTRLIQETPPSIMYLHVGQISDNFRCAFKFQNFLTLFLVIWLTLCTTGGLGLWKCKHFRPWPGPYFHGNVCPQ